jgi:hypothetical protein
MCGNPICVKNETILLVRSLNGFDLTKQEEGERVNLKKNEGG